MEKFHLLGTSFPRPHGTASASRRRTPVSNTPWFILISLSFFPLTLVEICFRGETYLLYTGLRT